VIVADRPEVPVEPGYRGLLALADVVGYRLEAFQRKIAPAVLGPERECLILLPRGNAKTTSTALVALHHLLSTEGAKVYFVAASVPQARIAFEAAADFARRLGHDNLVFRHLELRWCEDPDEPTVFTRHMRVLGGEGPRLHGLSPPLMVLDELQAVTRTDIYPALASALHRAPNSKLVVISTAGSGVDSPARHPQAARAGAEAGRSPWGAHGRPGTGPADVGVGSPGRRERVGYGLRRRVPERGAGGGRLEHALGKLLAVLLRHERAELLGVGVEAVGHFAQRSMPQPAVSRDHGEVSNARRAAAIAAAASASPPSAHSPSTAPVAGLMDSETVSDSVHSPSIQCLAIGPRVDTCPASVAAVESIASRSLTPAPRFLWRVIVAPPRGDRIREVLSPRPEGAAQSCW
jgi:hypothetical protein